MGYVAKNLIQGERIVFATTLHWWAVVGPTIYAIILLVIPSLLLSTSVSSSTTMILGGIAILWIFLAVSMILLLVLVTLAKLLSTEIAVTNKRVLIKTGILRRRTLELHLGKVESFSADEPIIGRLLGFETVHIVGSGGTQQHLRYVKNGSHLRQLVLQGASYYQDRGIRGA